MAKGNTFLAGRRDFSDLLPRVMAIVNNNILYILNVLKEYILNVLR